VKKESSNGLASVAVVLAAVALVVAIVALVRRRPSTAE
jgi:hypothetical protein